MYVLANALANEIESLNVFLCYVFDVLLPFAICSRCIMWRCYFRHWKTVS